MNDDLWLDENVMCCWTDDHASTGALFGRVAGSCSQARDSQNCCGGLYPWAWTTSTRDFAMQYDQAMRVRRSLSPFYFCTSPAVFRPRRVYVHRRRCTAAIKLLQQTNGTDDHSEHVGLAAQPACSGIETERGLEQRLTPGATMRAAILRRLPRSAPLSSIAIRPSRAQYALEALPRRLGARQIVDWRGEQ